VLVERVVDEVLDALRDCDWETVRLALHPYLHWQLEDGTILRGRKKVLAMLTHASPEPPSAVEVRDGQIYRWLQ
jgi:hypothetical protein